MTKEEAITRLKNLQYHTDTEWAHIQADSILCELLVSLGYEDVVDDFKDIQKWYA